MLQVRRTAWPSLFILSLLVIFWGLLIVYPELEERISLRPGFTFGQFYVWNPLSGALAHRANDLADLLVNCLVTLYSAHLTYVWGTSEYLKFCFLSLLASGYTTFAVKSLSYLVHQDTSVLFTPLGGSHGLTLAFLVAFKQQMPDNVVLVEALRVKRWLMSNVRRRVATRHPNQSLPFLYIILCCILGVLEHNLSVIWLALGGGFWGWTYLRYFQNRDGIIGDKSSDFGLVSFFPEFLQGPIGAVVRPIGNICCFWIRPKASSAPTNILPVTVEGTQNKEADRRRQLGLKALDERLAKLKNLPRETLVINPTTQ